MGAMTFAEFGTELDLVLGDRDLDSTRIGRWVNFAYHDIAGAIDFEEFDADVTTPTVAGTPEIDAPADSQVIQIVKDVSNDILLGWIPKTEYYRRAVLPQAAPKYWTRHSDLIKLNPVPDGIYDLLVIYKTPPAVMSGSDVTEISAVWDQAIHFLSVHHALLSLGEEQRAAVWLQRAMAYIQSRMTQADLHFIKEGLGPTVPVFARTPAPGT